MNEKIKLNLKNDNNKYQSLTVALIFIVGLLNSNVYYEFMGIGSLGSLLLFLYYGLLIMMIFIIFINTLYKNLYKQINTFPYWLILAIAIIIKLTLLFIQFPLTFLPGENNFWLLVNMLSNIFLMIVLIKTISSFYYIKLTIWLFGIGALFTAIIPFIFYPEMIGERAATVDNYYFSGAFWNSAVISYISVGWLLIAISIPEKSRVKKVILISMFLLIALAGLSGLSRATFVSILVSVLVYLIMSNKLVEYIKIIIVSTIILGVSAFVFQDAIGNFTERIETTNIGDESRLVIWKDYIEDIPDYFLLGESSGEHKNYSKTGHGAHSVLLNWFTQYGILGLIGFVVLIIGVLRSINLIRKKQSKHVAAALYAWLAAYLSVGMINETGFRELSIFGGIGIILAWGEIVRRSSKIE